jgi:N-acetylneuraminate synthase
MKPFFEIKGRKIGYEFNPLVIAEIGINHEGSLKIALEMVDAAQREGLMALVPHVAHNPESYGDYARRNVSGSEAALLRHELAA